MLLSYIYIFISKNRLYVDFVFHVSEIKILYKSNKGRTQI
nr:MAG TPA: hypothetical protein [Caudoviricetes sp.]